MASREWPACARSSAAARLTQRVSGALKLSSAFAAMPSSAAMARASSPMREASQMSLVAATVPVGLGMLSATCMTARPPSGASPRPRDQARAWLNLMGRGAEQIVLQANHDGAILQAVVQVELAAEGEPQARGSQRRSHRFLEVKARQGKFCA